MNIGRRVKPSSSSRDRTAKLQTTRTISTETRTSSSTPRCRCATRMPTQHRSQSPSASSGQQASQRRCRSIFIKTSILFPFFKPITYIFLEISTYFLDKNQTLKPLIFSLEGTETCRNNKNRKLTNIFNDGIKTRFDKEKLTCAQTSNSTANNGQRETQKFTEDATNSNRHQ